MKSQAIKVLDQQEGDGWVAYHSDCVDVLRGLPDASIHYTVFSPPFASLYTYSASDRDMGNVKDAREFADHFAFLIPELLRVTKPGRLLSMHCMNLPTSKARDGYIGISDFRGELIRAFIAAGWIFHSEVVIWKDPVTAMQRTKALGLLHKQLKKDSCMSRQGIPDYLITFRKPGENPERVSHTDETFPVEVWQRYASPVWMDINPFDTLQHMSAREDADERHICPLQLEVIERALRLWTNPGDTVLSPFMGIGSEGWVARKMGRRFVGAELKASYFKQAVANLRNVSNQHSVFDLGEFAPPANETTDPVAVDWEDDERTRSLQAMLADSQKECESLSEQVIDLKADLQRSYDDVDDARAEAREAEKKIPGAYEIAASVHDLMRDRKFLTDPAHDVPYHVTPTIWRNELERIIEGALP